MHTRRDINGSTRHEARALVGTGRDAGGRVLVPVELNGRGPFNFIFNTGAGRSAVTAATVRAIGPSAEEAPSILVHGVTGSTVVPTIRVESMSLRKVNIPVSPLPVIANAFEEADGFLSALSLGSECTVLDFDRNTIAPWTTSPLGGDWSRSSSVSIDPCYRQVLIIRSRVQGIAVKTIIDTGAQATLGNLALHQALAADTLDTAELVELVGASVTGQIGIQQPLPMMEIGDLRIFGARIAYGDLPLFEHLKFSTDPAMLLGMDIIGQFAGVAIDYKHQLVHFRQRTHRRHRLRRG